MRAQVINGPIRPSHPRAGFVGGPLRMLEEVKSEGNKELKEFRRKLAITELLTYLVLSGAIAAGVASGYITEKNKGNNQNTDKTVLIQNEK